MPSHGVLSLFAVLLLGVVWGQLKQEILACGSMSSLALAKGDAANICIKVGEYYMTFKAPVDQMTLLSVKNGYGNSRFSLTAQNTTIPINIQVNQVSPYEIDPTQPLDDSNQYRADKYWIAQDAVDPNIPDPIAAKIRVIPYFTAIVQLKEGRVSGIVWDDGCFGCSSSSTECVKGFCSVLSDECYYNGTAKAQDQLSDCDPKIYIGWQGSDANKNILTSSELVPSRFIRYSAGNALNNIRAYTGGLKDQQTL